ncbi:MAG: phage tail sheath family protein [Anaerolineales bacterium]|nr:phage tail sheath family protein [Anaerolineales bacterium]MCB0031540.1 phage tail sheath family protein [Anaerolineales bacterium]MCB8963000.1 phage tail sheath family protein [Ardenticatenales bacterium]
MATYKTPGVYVEEIATLPPSVAEVATAVPYFIGYSAAGAGRTARINTLLEFEQQFGGPRPESFTVETMLPAGGGAPQFNSISRLSDAVTPEDLLYYSLALYFNNGGGSCYVASVGSLETTPTLADFVQGLALAAKEDEPTLLLFPDATRLPASDYYNLCDLALAQCGEMKDRFVLIDVVPAGEPAEGAQKAADVPYFRDKIGAANLKYGAAYYPYLQTNIPYRYALDGVRVTLAGDTPTVQSLEALAADQTVLYNAVKGALASQRVILPPCAALAGVYARVDRERGVWKAPANVSLNSIIAPLVKITNREQEELNIDPTAGKSVNAIRAFTGKGILVWGARTLAGNDNEWRYVSVRRLFNLIEESIQKSTSFAVFEPNDATTWLKVRAMIESYLFGLWEQGALAGSRSEDAYFVRVGLGQTMTVEQVNDGYLIIEVGVAAVRPAEFIVLRFSHKLQEA